ncbi:Trans-aconitate 3-methyltransferase [Purpureocillium takamizusanense]|uniref:Trans-aconitate 3-methyltransferase n=1 Tax=Purpureocillium takamizusanense TaxID=2060973 RepID=A0A9Q8Q6X1_9HYPO|nr:Trans-aconitate 3-methyltransferase [Purpureocillium takamizusanense]UNI13606.1 Trans-aconitate 3-methyltransferase [Purpureocillium takamizusanense]
MAASHSSNASGPKVSEQTFSSYDQSQGQKYVQARHDYSPHVYQAVFEQHTSTGGRPDTLLDVGCGPGLVARALAPRFAHVIGLDPSEGMLAVASSLGGTSSTGDPIRWERGAAEDLDKLPGLAPASVDLITAANAAHWFDMPPFWAAAARALRPGGSVAIWTNGDIRAHPSMPAAARIQAAMDRHFEVNLRPHMTPGNQLVMDGYVDLPLPWTPTPGGDTNDAASAVAQQFDKARFVRKDWAADEDFFVSNAEVDLDGFEKMMATMSAQTRWNQANPELVGTDKDVVKILRREIENALHEAGVDKGKEVLKGSVLGVLLVVKKRSDLDQ